MGIISFLRGLFHTCDMKPVVRTHSNPKGEVWIFQCSSCPKRVEGFFDSKGRCFSAKPIKEEIQANGKA